MASGLLPANCHWTTNSTPAECRHTHSRSIAILTKNLIVQAAITTTNAMASVDAPHSATAAKRSGHLAAFFIRLEAKP